MDKGLYIKKNINFNLLLEKLKENNFIEDLKRSGELYECVFKFNKDKSYNCEINLITGDIKIFNVKKKFFFFRGNPILTGKIEGDGSFISVNYDNIQSLDKIFYENKNGLVFERYKSGSIYKKEIIGDHGSTVIEEYRNGKLAVKKTTVENRSLVVENFNNNNSTLSSIKECLFDAASKKFMMQKKTIYRDDGTLEKICEHDVNNNSSIKKFTLFNPEGKMVMDYDYVRKIIEYISPIDESKRFKVIVDPADSKGCRIGCSPEELESNLPKAVMDDIFSEGLSFLNGQTGLHPFLANGYILANARAADKIYCLYAFEKEECNSLGDLQKVLFFPENTSEFKSVIISNLENNHALCAIVPNPYLEKNRGKKGIIMDSAASESKFETVALPNGKVGRKYLDLPDGLVADIIIGNSSSDQKNGCCTYMAMEGVLTTSEIDLENIMVSTLPTSRKTENTKVKFIFNDDGTAVKGEYSAPVYPTKLESEIVANLNERFEGFIGRYKMVRGDDSKLKKCSAFSYYRQIPTLLESYDPEKMEMRADSFDQKHFDVTNREYTIEFQRWGTRYTNGEFESKDYNRNRFVKRKMDELGLDTPTKNLVCRKNCWQKKKALLVRSRTEHVDTMSIRIW